MPPPDIEFMVACPEWGVAESWRPSFRRALISAAQQAENKLPKAAQLCIILTNDAEMRAQNKRWRSKDSPTNVLSFPSPDNIARQSGFLGDILLGYETVAREAAEQQKTLEDHALHLIVHGYLHLLGYDHETEKQAKRMEALETKILLALGYADPYEGGSLKENRRSK